MSWTRFLCFLAGWSAAGAATAGTYRTVTGEVVLDKSCGKRTFADFRLLIQQESAIDYARYQMVPMAENGRYTVLLHGSYHYNFRVIEADDLGRVARGVLRFDYQQAGQVPVITAICPPVEAKPK